jgi:hypothetical protein
MRPTRDSPNDRRAVVAGVVAVALAGVWRRARGRPAVEPAAPVTFAAAPRALPVADPHLLALERIAAEADVPRAVGQAYRSARRAFNATRDAPEDDAALEALRMQAQILWSCATLAEASSPGAAKKLARDVRGLLRVLDEHAAVVALARAASEHPAAARLLQDAASHAADRASRLRRRIDTTGKTLFGAKPAQVVGRLAADH